LPLVVKKLTQTSFRGINLLRCNPPAYDVFGCISSHRRTVGVARLAKADVPSGGCSDAYEVVMVLLALMQANSLVLDVDANCAALEAAAGSAASAGSSVLVTPELFPVGYAPLRPRSPAATASGWFTAFRR
jgi:hypothetical protein